MYSSIQLAAKYLNYCLKASNGKGHGMHSPFVFDFIQHVLNNKSGYQPPEAISRLRQVMRNSRNTIRIDDPGAGTRAGKGDKRSLSSIAKHVVKPKKYGEVLYRLAKHYQPNNIIELGTSLGITTSYFSSANPRATIYTIEGSEAVADVAGRNFSNLQLQNIELIRGRFDDVLPGLLKKQMTFDMAYVDGNHLYSPTINYFHILKEKINSNSILVFDDIHWSREMEAAWEEIKRNPEVQYTIDIFFLGFVFFKKEFKVKQDFVIRF